MVGVTNDLKTSLHRPEPSLSSGLLGLDFRDEPAGCCVSSVEETDEFPCIECSGCESLALSDAFLCGKSRCRNRDRLLGTGIMISHRAIQQGLRNTSKDSDMRNK